MEIFQNQFFYFILIGIIVFVVFSLVSKLIKKSKEYIKLDNVVYNNDPNIDFEKLKKISHKPFFFGIERFFISMDQIYFDGSYLYMVNKQKMVIKIKLTDIKQLKSTYVKLNNRRIWRCVFQYNSDLASFKFIHNYSIRNKNFAEFIELLKKTDPNIGVSKLNFWNR